METLQQDPPQAAPPGEPFDPNAPGAPPRWVNILEYIAIPGFIAAQIYGFVSSPPDAAMGNLQKIMYVHVPTAWAGMVAFLGVFIGSVLYAWQRRPRYDLVAAACAEVGVMFTALTLVLGAIWGRPTWGVWWTWDPRLTTTAIMLLLYAGYLALRAFTDDEERRARWSAWVGILAFVNVPIVYMSVRWWRTLHQVQSGPSTLEPVYLRALALNTLAVSLVLIWLVARRYHTSEIERRVEALREEAALAEGGSNV
ncbi:MAG TPA: cytochrome c biogenesis protein CcsA [Longimicrobiaceae bacterium]|nr:cytochrome c biogenesis protein CcsA [Longimicrobiaceae bacterium]